MAGIFPQIPESHAILSLNVSHIESLGKCITYAVPTTIKHPENHMSDYLFFRVSYIVNPKPATPHRITIRTMMINSEPKLYKTSMLLKMKEMKRRIIPPIMSFRL